LIYHEQYTPEAKTIHKRIDKEVKSLQAQITGVNEQIVAETANLIKLDTDVPTDIDLLNSQKLISQLKEKIKQYKRTLYSQQPIDEKKK
jgi:bifunctional ADP-heptose synthase (sugar kinase/adenylyltransferase)